MWKSNFVNIVIASGYIRYMDNLLPTVSQLKTIDKQNSLNSIRFRNATCTVQLGSYEEI